jgi:hypothetical protein
MINKKNLVYEVNIYSVGQNPQVIVYDKTKPSVRALSTDTPSVPENKKRALKRLLALEEAQTKQETSEWLENLRPANSSITKKQNHR